MICREKRPLDEDESLRHTLIQFNLKPFRFGTGEDERLEKDEACNW